MEELIILHERSLYDVAFCNNIQALDALLSKDFREFNANGRIYGKQEIMQRYQTSGPLLLSMHDCHLLSLENDAYILYYNAFNQKENAWSIRCSIWKKMEDAFQLFFHQSTHIMQKKESL